MRWIPVALLVLVCAGPAATQDRADRARIDDFAVPGAEQAEGTSAIEQLQPDAAPLPPPVPVPARDSTAPAGASTPADSAIRATPPIAGTDRCDPQQATADNPACRTILETRAGDFAATTPAPLSAEQALIASQAAQAARRDPVTSDRRVRMAGTGATDDELRSNQELATIYLGRQRQQIDHPDTGPEPQVPKGLQEVIEALRQTQAAGR